MLHPQNGQSLTLQHLQQLWGHLLEWQVRSGELLGRPPPGWQGTFTNKDMGALWADSEGERGPHHTLEDLAGMSLPLLSFCGPSRGTNSSGMESARSGPGLKS